MTHDPIDVLVQRWQRDPNASTTVALCDALRDSPRVPLVEQVGELAAQRYPNDVAVLLSVARMYIESSRFAEAQNVLVAAGKQSPRDPHVYRWLGETLLRKGDAERAHKVFERAIQLGARDAETRLWYERAVGFRPLQASAGNAAVAAELAHSPEGARPRLDSEGPTTIERRPPPATHAAPSSSRGAAHPARLRTGPVPDDAPTWGPPSRPRRAPPPQAPILPSLESLRDDDASAGAGAQAVAPHPRDLLEALALAGVYEPRSAAAATPWDRAAPRPRRRGAGAIIGGMALFLAASAGVYVFYRHKRAEDHVRAEVILANVEARLDAAERGSLKALEHDLGRALELETRSPRGALDWARERALTGLLEGGADVAFEDAMARAKEMGVAEEKFAFAHVASFLFQGDTAGAAAVLPRWDAAASGDPWYETIAGAALERAGDLRARERYTRASQIEPALLIARFGLTRWTALEGEAERSAQMARQLRTDLPDRAEPVALVALAWGRDPMRESTPPPPEVEDVGKRAGELPAPLKFVPHAVAALRAIDRHDFEGAVSAVRNGLAAVDSPAAAAWLGAIALSAGNEDLARRGALAALQLSAVYEPARALAARVALATGRLDEALKATEELDPTLVDVAVVRAACAYERADADGLNRALQTLSAESRKQPALAALTVAGDALAGRLKMDASRLVALSRDDAPWADLIAMDAALDGGDLATADKIAAAWGTNADARGQRALRLARLARYEARLDTAEVLSQAALDHGTVTPRVLSERVFVLSARGRSTEVGPLLARYPLVLGPLATWLSAYASASAGAIDAARGKTASLDPPPTTASFEARVVAASALAASKDRKRAADYVRDLLATGSLNEDLVNAASALGFHRVDHGRRNPTYE